MNPLAASMTSKSVRVFRLDAAGVADGLGVSASPGSVLIESDDSHIRTLAAGCPADVDQHDAAADARQISLPRSVLLPAFVNAHCHLDLTHVGPRPHRPEDGFVSWIRMVLEERAADDATIRSSAHDGISRSLSGGVAAVGDIVGRGSMTPFAELQRAAVGGVSFEEVFGLGAGEPRGAATASQWAGASSASEPGGARLGVSPHAPYSAGPGVFRASHCPGAIAAAHVSESIEELELVARGTGPFRAFLKGLGVWDDALLNWFGRGAHPVDLALDAIGEGLGSRWLFAHVNHAEDRHIERMAERGVGVAFCARAHAYFGHAQALGAHRWREMLEANVTVCLGTDSVINLPVGQESARITPLDDARFLFRDGATNAETLLRMITANPARALELPDSYSFAAGRLPGLVSVEVDEVAKGETPAAAALRSSGGVEWLTRGGARFGPLAGAAAR